MTKTNATARIDAMETQLNDIARTLAILAQGHGETQPAKCGTCDNDATLGETYCDDCLGIYHTIAASFGDVGETQPKAKGKARETQPAKVVAHDVTVDFDATVTDLVPVVLAQLKAKVKPNASMIPFGIGDETARPSGRTDYRIYLATADNRRFKSDRKAAGIPMLDACLALADAVDAVRPSRKTAK